jgi:hypothetical protein
MRENEFRDRLRDALGEPPPLPAPQLTPSDAGVSRGYPRGMLALAVALAVLLVLGLVASRVALRPQGMIAPAGSDTFPCSLPVMVMTFGNSGENSVSSVSLGFVNIPAGEFQVDPAATVLGLPVGAITGQNFYSAELKRWVPAPARAMSPDGRSYVYVKILPEGANYSNGTASELHVVDVAKKTDRKVWTYAASLQVIGWDASGIIANTVPFRGGNMLLWRVDPAGGRASQLPPDADPTRLPMAAMPNGGSAGYLGTDGHGQYLFRLGSRDPGTNYSVVVVASGQSTTLYSGKNGDPFGFDPGGVYSDAHGVWLSNIGGSRVWLWSAPAGLRSFPVTGLPPVPSGYPNTYTSFTPAGACVAGVFTGVAATGLRPAPTPTPSPSPPQIDWSPLIAKPLNLQQLSSGARCPVSPQVDLTVTTNGPKKGGPNYGFGQGPVYVSGQLRWYAGAQAILFLTDPKYTGPVLVRSMRLDGTGSLTLTGEGATTLDGGAIGLAQTSSPPYWGMWLGRLTPNAPGCYGIQFDGTSFSAISVIAVSPGPVPPG